LEKFKKTLNDLRSATNEDQKVRLEHVLLNSLHVYDFDNDESDVFEKVQE
jgi:hypothetical protein